MPSESDLETFVKLLLPRRHGYPLWVPEPVGVNPARAPYIDEGHQIGDVGMITGDGHLDVFFHIYEDPNTAVGALRTQLPPGVGTIQRSMGDLTTTPRYHTSPTAIACASISERSLGLSGSIDASIWNLPVGTNLGYAFTFSATEGALVALPDGASQSDLTRGSADFLRLALENGLQWYNFVTWERRRGGLGVLADSLYLITGFDKSTSWAGGVYQASAGGRVFNATLQVTPAVVGGASYVYRWGESAPATTRTAVEHANRNQHLTLFIRGYKISVRRRSVGSLFSPPLTVSSVATGRRLHLGSEGTARPGLLGCLVSRSTSSEDRASSSEAGDPSGEVPSHEHAYHVDVEHIPEHVTAFHPADSINDYLLDKYLNASVAITHDAQWCSILKENEPLPERNELVRHMLEHYNPTVHLELGGVYFDFKDALSIREKLQIEMKMQDKTIKTYNNAVEIIEGPIRGAIYDIYNGTLRCSGSTSIGVAVLVPCTLVSPVTPLMDRRKIFKSFAGMAYTRAEDLRHPNLLPILGVAKSEGKQEEFVVTSQDNGCLMDYLAIWPQTDRCYLANQVADGLVFLHIFKLHGGLDENAIVISKDGTPKLRNHHMIIIPYKCSTRLHLGAVPFICFTAPEVLLVDRYTRESDVYAFGCLIIQIFTGQLPFSTIKDDTEVRFALSRGERLSRPTSPMILDTAMDDELWGLVNRCLAKDPAVRPLIYEVCVVLQGLTKKGARKLASLWVKGPVGCTD